MKSRILPVKVLSGLFMVVWLFACVGAGVDSGRIIINGRPRFPIEVYSLTSAKDTAKASDMGFNATINEFPAIIQGAHRRGMMITIPDWFEDTLNLDRLDVRIERYRRLPGIWAWNVGDEPDLRPNKTPPELVGRAARYIRSVMRDSLISVTLSGARGSVFLWPDYIHDVDVIRVTPYPLLERRDARLVYERLRMARKIGGHRAVIAVLDQWAMPGKPYPTIEQFKRCLYAALAADTSGLSVYQYEAERWKSTPGLINTMKQLLGEADRVGSVMVRAKERIVSRVGDIRRIDFTVGLRRFTFAVNLGMEPAQFTLSVNRLEKPRRYKSTNGKGEDIAVKNGKVSLYLAPGEAAFCESSPFFLPPYAFAR